MKRQNVKIVKGNFVPYHVLQTVSQYMAMPVNCSAEIVLTHNNPYLLVGDRAEQNLAEISDPNNLVCYVCKFGGSGVAQALAPFVDDGVLIASQISHGTYVVADDKVYRRISHMECGIDKKNSPSGLSKRIGPKWWRENPWAKHVYEDKAGFEGYAWALRSVEDSGGMLDFISSMMDNVR